MRLSTARNGSYKCSKRIVLSQVRALAASHRPHRACPLEMTILDGELKAGKILHVVNNKAIVILISIEYKAKKLD